MPILGFVIDEIQAKRVLPKPGRLDINSKLDIKQLNLLKNESWGEFLEIVFEFSVSYNNNIGILFKGRLAYNSGLDEIKESLKDKKLPKDVDIEIKNFLLNKLVLFASIIAERLGMPMPIPIPTIGKKEDKNIDYIG